MVMEKVQWVLVFFVQGYFSGFSGVGFIHQINDIMDQFVYGDILKEKMVPHADNMPLL